MKEKRITRTIQVTTAKIMFADTYTEKISVEDRDIVGYFKSDKDILAYINVFPENPVQAIKVITYHDHKEKRAMLESDFYRLSMLVNENN